MSVYKMEVFGTLQFAAIHCWPGAVPPVEFLQNPHRHMFMVEFRCAVTHSDRDIEFISFKQKVEDFCERRWARNDIGAMSCEMLGMALLDAFPEMHRVTVSEDGENGATVWRDVQWEMKRVRKASL